MSSGRTYRALRAVHHGRALRSCSCGLLRAQGQEPKAQGNKRVICVKPDPELERSLVEYQNAERQLQSIVLQKHQLQLQLNEISLAEEELKKSKGDVFKSIGSVMVKTTKKMQIKT